MPRITICHNDAGATMEMQGKLAGDGVKEALDTWTKLACAGSPINVDLSALTSVDGDGRRLLSEMRPRAVRLIGSTLLTPGLIREITS